jgi:RNA polymerase sigma factor (sigma-70 family)
MNTEPVAPSLDAAQLGALAEAIQDVARNRRLAPDQADDFRQSVHARLLERDYDVFRKFSGRSSLRTYLRVVVGRMLLDWRNASFGKWRASAAARRLGPFALQLERLIYRDGHTVAEAIETVRRHPSAPPERRLQDIAHALPVRQVRRQVSTDAIAQEAVAFEDPVEAAERRREALRRQTALRAAVRDLGAADRRLLDLRYREGHSVRSVATQLQMDVKIVYRRFDRIRRSLRESVLQASAFPG